MDVPKINMNHGFMIDKMKKICKRTHSDTRRKKLNPVQQFIKANVWLLLIPSIYLRNQLKFNPLTTNVPIICSANQLTGFYMMGTLVVKGLNKLIDQVERK